MLWRDAVLKIRNFKDFYTGILFVIFGGGFAWGATKYNVGTAAKMGPGFFPLILGVLLTLLGGVVLVRCIAAAGEEQRVGPLALKPALFLFGSLAAFSFLLRSAGLVVSIVAVIVISSLASRESRFLETLVSAIVLCAASVAIFVYALNLQIPVWPTFISP